MVSSKDIGKFDEPFQIAEEHRNKWGMYRAIAPYKAAVEQGDWRGLEGLYRVKSMMEGDLSKEEPEFMRDGRSTFYIDFIIGQCEGRLKEMRLIKALYHNPEFSFITVFQQMDNQFPNQRDLRYAMRTADYSHPFNALHHIVDVIGKANIKGIKRKFLEEYAKAMEVDEFTLEQLLNTVPK